MQSTAKTPDEYFASLPDDRKAAMTELRKAILKNLPKGFKEQMTYGMPGYVIPHKLYPAGYHVNPELPIGLLAIASQKNFIAVYHMGVYSDPKLLKWFTGEYAKRVKGKLDMGKSCIRFKKPDQVPFDLIGELASKMTVEECIAAYEKGLKK